MSRSIKSFLAAAVVAAGVSLSGAAQASDCGYGYQPPVYQPPAYHLKTVTVWDYVRKPYVSYITKYDHCGEPYRVRHVTWQTVRVPVVKTVKVWH